MKKTVSPTCSPKTAVAYARYSSAGQRDVSIEQQLNDIHAYAEREGYTIVHEYADHARSGFKSATTRSQFQAMMTAARNGTFDTVIAWKTDRFSRRREDSAVYKGQLQRLGVRVLFVMEPIPEGSAGILLESMLEATAEWYSRTLSENITRGMYDNARRGLHNGVKVFGYNCAPDGQYVINQEDAAVVQMIFERYTNGFSAKAIANELNGMALTNQRGHQYTHSNVLYILSNERYIGNYHWGDVYIPDGMPAIISKKTFEEAQRMKAKTGRHVEQGSVEFLLTGKAFCGMCGAAMIGDSGTSRTGERYYYYSCQAHKARKGCEKKSLQKEYLEDVVINYMLDTVLQPDEIKRVADVVMQEYAEARRTSPIAALEEQLTDVNSRIANTNTAISRGIYTDSTVVMLRDLEAEAKEIQRQIDVNRFVESQFVGRERVEYFLSQVIKGDRHELPTRRFIIHTFVNAVYVFDDHLKLVTNNIDGNLRIPLDELPTGSDSGIVSPPNHPHSNQRVTVYIIPLGKQKRA